MCEITQSVFKKAQAPDKAQIVAQEILKAKPSIHHTDHPRILETACDYIEAGQNHIKPDTLIGLINFIYDCLESFHRSADKRTPEAENAFILMDNLKLTLANTKERKRKAVKPPQGTHEERLAKLLGTLGKEGGASPSDDTPSSEL